MKAFKASIKPIEAPQRSVKPVHYSLMCLQYLTKIVKDSKKRCYKNEKSSQNERVLQFYFIILFFLFGYMESNIAASIQIKINLMRFEFFFIVYNIILLFTFQIFGYTFHQSTQIISFATIFDDIIIDICAIATGKYYFLNFNNVSSFTLQ